MNKLPDIIFITGTGTDVGKTVVATAVCQGLSDAGHAVVYWKPVQTGDANSDREKVLTDITHTHVHVAPESYSFPLPLSPDQAAAESGRDEVSLQALNTALATMRKQYPHHTLIIEGAGGLYVPLNQAGETWLDLLRQWKCPILLVAHSGLGTINHTSLSMEAIRTRGLPLLGVVLSGELHPLNERSIQTLHPQVKIFALPLKQSLTQDLWTKKTSELLQFINRANGPAPQNDISAMDAKHVWHPYTQHKTAGHPEVVTQAQGPWLELASGERLLDCASSWWVNTLGHGRPELGQALINQQQKLDHVLFAGLTHEPATDLARQLSALSNHSLTRAFYSDNGSTAVEVALKMAYQFWHNQKQHQRKSFLAFNGSYHGDTFGAMAVSGSGFNSIFRPFLFDVKWAAPLTHHNTVYCPQGLLNRPEREQELAFLLEQHHHDIAAVILEPLVQGAGGMLMQPPHWLQFIGEQCKKYSLPLIIDEVFTGFGRCGSMFAYQQAMNVEPSILCLSKAITGGTLPLGVTLTNEEIFAAFYGDERASALLHGHSYTGNPIICAVALAAIKLTQDEQIPAKAKKMQHCFEHWIKHSGKELKVENSRALGGILAFELPHSGPSHYFHTQAQTLTRAARQQGLFIRTLGNTIYFMPPPATTADIIEWGLERLTATLHSVYT